MKYNGKDVTLTKNHNNASIKVHILPEKEMRKIGFTDYAKDRWYYSRLVCKDYISFNLTIPKENPNDWQIDVLDEDFCQPYDYQRMIVNNSKNEVVFKVFENVEKQMEYLSGCGVISGHEYGDYI